MIELQDLHKSFGAQKVLDGLSLTMNKGEITVIIGRSGEGKSVLLKHMIGLLKPDSGSVLVDKVKVEDLKEKESHEFRKKFGMLFQNAALFDSLNVFDNVAFPLVEHTKKSQEEIKQRVLEVLGLVGLENIERKMPSELSGGMRKRVGLARAIALSPQILLYDEPTTGLDPLMTESVHELIVTTHQKLKATSVVISHDMEGAFRIADKVAMLYEGKILLEGKEDVFQKSDHPFIRKFLDVKQNEVPNANTHQST